MATYYAWTNFTVTSDDGKKTTRIAPGDKVAATDLGVTSEEFAAYVDNGAVRTVPYPDMGDFPGSPIELAKAQAEAAAAGGYFDTQYGRVGSDEVPPIDPETGAPLKTEPAKK